MMKFPMEKVLKTPIFIRTSAHTTDSKRDFGKLF